MKLEAFGFFIDDFADAVQVQQQLAEDFPVQASIGVWLDEIEVLDKNESAIVNGREFKGGVIVRKSFCREVSACVLGADSDTKVNSIKFERKGCLVASGAFKGQAAADPKLWKKIHPIGATSRQFSRYETAITERLAAEGWAIGQYLKLCGWSVWLKRGRGPPDVPDSESGTCPPSATSL